MGHALIWLEGASALLFASALLVTWTVRPHSRWLQAGLTGTAALLLLLPPAAVTFVTLQFRVTREFGVPTDWFFYSLSFFLAGLLGVILVCRAGLRRGPDDIPMARTWPRGRLLLLLAGSLILWGITLTNMDLAVRLRIASARAEAGEVLLAVTPPHVPDKENAAPLYRQAFPLLKPLSWDAWEKHLRRSADMKSVRAALRTEEVKQFLASQEKGLALLRRGAALPGCSFERSYQHLVTSPPRLDLPETTQMENGARLLCLSALVHAAAGDGKSAVEELRAAWGVIRHTPTVFALQVVALMDDDACRTLEKVLLLTTPRPEDLARLPLDEQPPYLQQLAEEVAVYGALNVAVVSLEASAWHELILHGKTAPPSWLDGVAEATIVPLWRAFLVPDDLAWSRDTWAVYRRQTQPPHEPAYRTWADARNATDQLQGGLITTLYMKPRLRILTRRSIDALTRRALARVAVAQTAYRVEHGRYAATIEELLPGSLRRVPVDPLEGQPLHMHRAGLWRVLCDARSNPHVETVTAWDEPPRRPEVVFLLRDEAKD
jgi:hypothetical protein